ncbi:MAG: hypothetical protein ACI8TL_000749, partial [Natronomonas sp.]
TSPTAIAVAKPVTAVNTNSVFVREDTVKYGDSFGIRSEFC